MKTEVKSEDILKLKFYSGDLDKEVTVKEFFIELLKVLWDEQESFSGKRPFGNSGWDSDLIKCLVQNDLITGKIDEDGYIEDVNWDVANKFVAVHIIPSL